MVAASATAILNDINLSATAFGHPNGCVKFDANPEKRGVCRRFADAFLTVRINQGVSASAPPRLQRGQKRKCWKQSKCPENNTCRKTATSGRLAPDDCVRGR